MRDDKRPTGDLAAITSSYESGSGPTKNDLRRGNRKAGATREQQPGLLRRRVLGDFVLGSVLGHGGCGTVYRAEQRMLGRSVVVKVIHRSLSARRDAAERFAREAQLASRFDHPYAAHIYSFGIEHDGLMWIAMELIDGTPLGQLVRQSGPMGLERFVGLFERLCDVVQSAHDQGIVHRDIKPSNVMVIARAGRLMPKLVDFGLAKLIDAGDVDVGQAAGPRELDGSSSNGTGVRARGLTHQGQVLGSPMYMAPEQWRDAATAGPLADQYALALVAYEALTGSRPFAGATIEELARQHRVAPLPALPGNLPPALHTVLARACAKRAEQRFATLTELAAALRDATLDATSEPEAASAISDEVSPYPGLASYTTADHASYVGRERDVEELIHRLHTQSLITVVGPSGSGKTSFLAAGVIPSLPPGWCAELIRPGGDPPAVLAAIAAQCDAPPYRQGPHDGAAVPAAAIATGLIGLAESRSTTLVVIVDQGEELFTMCADDARRAAFAEALVVASASPHVRIILALRDDFLCRVEQLPAWRGLLGRAVRVLGVPGHGDLERMITEPARRRGFSFDDPALPREIVDQIADRPGALSLVAFTAAQLWEHRDRQARKLTRGTYEHLGGVIGALVQHADSVVDRMSIPDRRQVRLIFRRLITAEGARALISRAELESSLDGSTAVLDRLLAARLIVSRDDDTGDRIEVIHETLATTWPRLANWRRADADGARLQEQLAVAARHWHDRGQPAELLWRGEPLVDLQRWHGAGDHNLTPIELAFVRASVAAAARARRVRIAIVAAMFALLTAGLLALGSANREIAEQRTAAVERLRASFEERGRLALAEGDDPRAMLYLAEAARIGAHGPGFDLLASRAAVSLDAGLQILGHTGAGIWEMDVSSAEIVTVGSDQTLSRWDRSGRRTQPADRVQHVTLVGELAISLSSEGDVVATERNGVVRWRAARAVADPSMRPSGIAASSMGRIVVAFSDKATIWDVDSGRFLGELPHDQGIHAIALERSGELVATGDGAGVVRTWTTRTQQLVTSCDSHTGAVADLEFALDPRSVVSGGDDGDVRICDATSGATRHRLIGHSHEVVTVDVTSDGLAIVSGGRDGSPRIWDARTGLLIRVLEGHRGTVTRVQFSPDDSRILTLGVDGTARIWSRDGTALGSLQGHGGHSYDGHWDTDGRHVITTSFDGAIRRWDPGRAIKTAIRQAHEGEIADVVVSSNDRWLLSGGPDRGVLWDRRSLQLVAELVHDAPVYPVMFGRGDTTALTTDQAGYARLWEVPSGRLLTRLGPGITAATFAHDGTVIAASEGSVTFWTAAGAKLGTIATGYPAHALLVDPTGRWLFIGGQASSIQVIDLAARTPATRLSIGSSEVLALATDGSRVAIADGATIRLWQIGTWQPLSTLIGHKNPVTGIWFLSDGRLVSAATDATLVWRRDGRLTATLADTNMALALATSSGGALFATTASDGAIRIWDAASYRLLLRLPGHRLPAFGLQLTHDGASVISGGNDGRIVTWDLARQSYSPSKLADVVRCRVPLRLEGDVVVPRELDFDDAACRALVLDR
jgi:WD40 repeat protein/serine/threonine protein kinase